MAAGLIGRLERRETGRKTEPSKAEPGTHRPWRLRSLHQPGVVEPGLGWLQVPGELRVPAGLQAVPVAQPPDEGVPRQHQGDQLPCQPRQHVALPAVVRLAGRTRLLDHRPVRHPLPAAAQQGEDPRGRAGHRHHVGARWHRVPRCVPDRQRLPVRVLVRAVGDGCGRNRRQLRRAGVRRAAGRPLGRPAARRRLRRGVHHFGEGAGQCRRPVRRPAQRQLGRSHRSSHRVLEGHPSGGAAAHHRSAPAGACVLRRHATPVLRDPNGFAFRHRHHRHPHRRTVHRGRRRRPQLPARADQRSPRSRPTAHRRHWWSTLVGPTSAMSIGRR